MMRLEADSTEYLYVPVEATTTEGEELDITRAPVEVAFTLNRIGPVDTDWLPAVWAVVEEVAYARVLVGPRNRGHRLRPGKWWVWVRVHAFPEVPIRRTDYLIVTGTRGSLLTQIDSRAALAARVATVSVASAALTGGAGPGIHREEVA
jgi:hypothetical protein